MVEDLKRDSATWRDEKSKKRTRSRYSLPSLIPQLTRSFKKATRSRILPIIAWRAVQVGDPRFHRRLKHLMRSVKNPSSQQQDKGQLSRSTHKRQATAIVDHRRQSCNRDPIIRLTLKQIQQVSGIQRNIRHSSPHFPMGVRQWVKLVRTQPLISMSV